MKNDLILQELEKFRAGLDVPAAFAGIVGADGSLELEALGVHRRGHTDTVSVNDRIHIGSCAKMLTACLFGTYVAEQQADWDMPVTKLFPDLSGSTNAAWHNRTVAELFHCVSGMVANPPRRYLKSGFADTRPLTAQRTELSELAFSTAPRKPGRFAYSNMSYIVMGAAIDRLSGTSFENALESRLLKPLGVTTAGYGPPPEVWGHAPGLYLGGVALFKGKPADPALGRSDNPPVLSSAGTLHLACADWARLLRLFLVDNHLGIIDAQVIDRILSLPGTKAACMSMGWAPVELEGIAYGAQGSNLRWSATALMNDQRQRTAFVVCNDGRSTVLKQSVALARQLLVL